MCSLSKTGKFNPALARIRVVEDLEQGKYFPVICRHCKVPKCREACPTEALQPLPSLPGVIVLKEELCIGCLECVEACPFGAIRVGPGKEVLKCDLCLGDPICVRFCYKTPPHSSPHLPYPKRRALEYVEPHRVGELKFLRQRGT